MYDGPTRTKFGQVSVAEPPRFDLLAFHDGSTLKEIVHDIPIPVLDQEDLHAQGINVTQLVTNAQDVDALGSCTCNTGTEHISERWAAAGKDISGLTLPAANGQQISLSAANAVTDEEFAILLYHVVTDQTGDTAQEWPPTDCGSSGLYVCQELIHLGFASSYQSAPNIVACLSLLQTGTVMQGGPWFNSWMQPDSNGFVDGDGSLDALHAAIQSGVAGGHETLQRGIAQVAQTADGTVELNSTVIRVRNSWSTQFALDGDYLVHASTLNYLAKYYDYKVAVVG
ncbi:MAG TPA: hypothetical protein VMA95_20620 [Streptosporangiaceae bacterium]|nr:hypothetical protein [Streptosporangiaceae bacterium]